MNYCGLSLCLEKAVCELFIDDATVGYLCAGHVGHVAEIAEKLGHVVSLSISIKKNEEK